MGVSGKKIFAFEWQDPNTQKGPWTVLPQRFKNSTAIFGENLAKHLKDLHLEEGSLLQYVDNILITSPTQESSDKNTVATLNHLADKGY